MKYKRTIGSTIFDVTNHTLMFMLMLITLYPIWYVLVASFSDSATLEYYTGLLVTPLGFSTEAYRAVMNNPKVWLGYKNTLIYVTTGTAVNIMMTSIGAYVLSRRKFFWKNIIMKGIIVTMYFGGGLIPTYLVMRNIGLYNNLWVMILPGAIGTWNLIIMRTSFMSIPYELEESAKLDGASDWTILFKIVLPLSLPVIAVMILYYGVGRWNGWFNAMIYLRDERKYPLQLILKSILIENQTAAMAAEEAGIEKNKVAETIKYATIMVATVPILMVYPFLQKYFVKGVMIGALKG